VYSVKVPRTKLKEERLEDRYERLLIPRKIVEEKEKMKQRARDYPAIKSEINYQMTSAIERTRDD
jgi:hypothetical protein